MSEQLAMLLYAGVATQQLALSWCAGVATLTLSYDEYEASEASLSPLI